MSPAERAKYDRDLATHGRLTADRRHRARMARERTRMPSEREMKQARDHSTVLRATTARQWAWRGCTKKDKQ